VAPQERLPGRLVGLVGIGQQAVVQHHPANRLPRHVIAQSLQLAVDVAVPPRRISRGHLQHQLADGVGLLGDWATLAPPVGPVVLPGDEPAMPAEQRVRGEECADLLQQLPAELCRGLPQTGSLRVVQTDAFLAQLFTKDFVLDPEIADCVLLLPVHPAGDGQHHESPDRFEHSAADCNRRSTGRKGRRKSWAG